MLKTGCSASLRAPMDEPALVRLARQFPQIELSSAFSFSKGAVSSRHFLIMLSPYPVLQEPNRRLVAERGVATTPLV